MPSLSRGSRLPQDGRREQIGQGVAEGAGRRQGTHESDLAQGVTVDGGETHDHDELRIDHAHYADDGVVSHHEVRQIRCPHGPLGAVDDLDAGGFQPENEMRSRGIGDRSQRGGGVGAER